MPVFLLPDEFSLFPDPALADRTGLLAIGGVLTPEKLIQAYQNGIFPWYHYGEPVHWYCLTPRLMLVPSEINVSKSMRNLMNRSLYNVTMDNDFMAVMHACRSIDRKNQEGSWIHYELMEAFSKLHDKGIAHSVEIWRESQLVGGLYGLAMGKMFCGESMFAKEPNTSKLALIHLCRFLESKKFDFIDCQQDTAHLRKMGARLYPQKEFFHFLQMNRENDIVQESWNDIRF
ncbi:MAG: leucyl/phenylalanyl-tRNA--protein transferase [Saprospiraceae bacterium]|nr:leucyl/phenylalanyl-tRNA--protein transferase [Saprospiraceae bacterium]